MVDIEKTGMYRGYKYVIFLNDELGYRSAYVRIPKEHKLCEVPYQELDIDVQNVIIDYSGTKIKGMNNEYCIGWHHNHSWDGVDEDAITKAHPNNAEELIAKAKSYHDNLGYYISLDSVEYECQCVIDCLCLKE